MNGNRLNGNRLNGNGLNGNRLNGNRLNGNRLNGSGVGTVRHAEEEVGEAEEGHLGQLGAEVGPHHTVAKAHLRIPCVAHVRARDHTMCGHMVRGRAVRAVRTVRAGRFYSSA